MFSDTYLENVKKAQDICTRHLVIGNLYKTKHYDSLNLGKVISYFDPDIHLIYLGITKIAKANPIESVQLYCFYNLQLRQMQACASPKFIAEFENIPEENLEDLVNF